MHAIKCLTFLESTTLCMYLVSIITKFYKGTREKFVKLCGSIIFWVGTYKNRVKNDKKNSF